MAVGGLDGDDGCLRLGVRPPAGRPVPPGESRTIVTSIGVVGHSGELREIALSSPRPNNRQKKCYRGPVCHSFGVDDFSRIGSDCQFWFAIFPEGGWVVTS